MTADFKATTSILVYSAVKSYFKLHKCLPKICWKHQHKLPIVKPIQFITQPPPHLTLPLPQNNLLPFYICTFNKMCRMYFKHSCWLRILTHSFVSSHSHYLQKQKAILNHWSNTWSTTQFAVYWQYYLFVIRNRKFVKKNGWIFNNKPLVLKSSTSSISLRRWGGDLLKTLWTVRSKVDQPSLWKTIMTLVEGRFFG